MTRVKSERGAVHYRCPADMRMTLCGIYAAVQPDGPVPPAEAQP